MTHAARLAFSLLLVALAGCATGASSPAASAQADATQATVEGRVVRVDTSPWAYDGNAVVVVASADRGEVAVQLPARWNLCKAPPPPNLDALKPDDRVRAIGTVTDLDGRAALVVCERAEHGLTRLD